MYKPYLLIIIFISWVGISILSVEGRGKVYAQSTSASLASLLNPIAASAGCSDLETFVTDVNYPDFSHISPGQYFIKTWRLNNNGTCNWDNNYTVKFVAGQDLVVEKSDQYQIPFTRAGNNVDFTVQMLAPTSLGTYRGDYKMINPLGRRFGDRFWVIVVVDVALRPPAAPEILAKFATTTEAKLTWLDKSNNEDRYVIQRWENRGSWGYFDIDRVAANETSYTNGGLQHGTVYYYRICAENTAGRLCSPIVSVTTTP